MVFADIEMIETELIGKDCFLDDMSEDRTSTLRLTIFINGTISESIESESLILVHLTSPFIPQCCLLR